MDWKDLNLHIENLIPGLIVLWELSILFGIGGNVAAKVAATTPAASPPASVPASGPALVFTPPPSAADALQGLFIVAMAYGVGVLSAVISRFVVDSASERGPRALVFGLLAHRDRTKLHTAFESDEKYKAELARERSRFLTKRCEAVAQWNCIYRAALNRITDEKDKAEVTRRRAQGRLVRNLVLPFTLAPFAITQNAAPAWPLSLIALAVGILMYAYAELNNFAEAADISARTVQSVPK